MKLLFELIEFKASWPKPWSVYTQIQFTFEEQMVLVVKTFSYEQELYKIVVSGLGAHKKV